MNDPTNRLWSAKDGLLARDPDTIRSLIIVIGFVQLITIAILWPKIIQEPFSLIIISLVLASNLITHLLNRYHSANLAVAFFISSMWLIVASNVVNPATENDLGLGYLIVLNVFSFILLGREWGLLTTLFSSILLAGTFSLRQRGIFSTPAYPTIYSTDALFNELAIQGFIATMLYFVMGYLHQASVESADATQALRDKTELFELITSNVPAQITYFDTDENFIYVNSRFLKLHEEAGDPVGRHRADVLSATVYNYSKPYLERALTGECVQFDYEVLHNGKVERISEIQFTPLFDEDTLQGIIALATDVTQMRRTESALYEAQRAESLGVVAGGIAHDFNNLLSAMLGQASLAKWKLDASHPALPHIEKNIDTTERASQLTKQMLAYSGRGNFEKQVFDLNKLLVDNGDLLRVSIPKQVALHVMPADGALHIKADLAQVQQVVMNLMLNAAQAIEGGNGNIWIETRPVTLNGEQPFGTQILDGGHYVCCSVRDDGCGMSAEVQRRIFDPFFTTKQNGSGLGLAAVSGIVHGHGGGLRVTSKVGEGTMFELLLPLVMHQDTAHNTPLTSADAPTAGGTVLLIDDEQIIADAVCDILSLHDIKMLYAPCGEQGISCYEANSAEIDVVLLDLTMPGMSGTAVFHELRDIDPKLPIIISSGYTRDAAAQEIIDEGSADFLPKPYNINDLIQAICPYLPQSA